MDELAPTRHDLANINIPNVSEDLDDINHIQIELIPIMFVIIIKWVLHCALYLLLKLTTLK